MCRRCLRMRWQHALMHMCALQEHIHRYTWGQRAGYINAASGECLGSTAQHILCQCPIESGFMAGCGGARWGAEQWLFVCCFFLLAVIIAPPPLKMASRHSIEQVGTHLYTLMLPQECIHAPATCRWREDVCFFPLKFWKLGPCYLLFLALCKIFSMRECLWLSEFFWFSGSGHYSTRTTVFIWRKGKDRQAPECNWTCSYTTTGSWQRLGKRLGSPREAWSQTRTSCASHWNRHTAPPLPSTSALGSVIQLLQTTPFCFAALFSDASLIKSPTATSLTPPEKVGVNTQTDAYQITLQRVFKVPREITCGRLPGPSQSRACRSVRTVLHLVWSAALLKPASFTREALHTDAKEQQNKSSRRHVQDKTLMHVNVIKRSTNVQTYVRTDRLFVSSGGQYGESGMAVSFGTQFLTITTNQAPSGLQENPFFWRRGKSNGYRSSCTLELSVKHMKEQAWVMPTAGWYLHISHVQCPLSQVLFEESYINRLLWQRPSSGRPWPGAENVLHVWVGFFQVGQMHPSMWGAERRVWRFCGQLADSRGERNQVQEQTWSGKIAVTGQDVTRSQLCRSAETLPSQTS